MHLSLHKSEEFTEACNPNSGNTWMGLIGRGAYVGIDFGGDGAVGPASDAAEDEGIEGGRGKVASRCGPVSFAISCSRRTLTTVR